ncbi:hypothetical protein HETIRDRAFT_411284 [Heterobasidion irregulare TC 32-1]|uniref:Uncharacterized protein n=1 Tax=Heterobasidion irregulare (strain TC 32-1) TaxID=747525 RepID=W4JX42_HETIT|nr:uncharacterized protein HETIRDRAFT_411284 [Heterobasidion irregulare TC 32-1]ETW78123.1 hypothetical protein HETIRDRAFT_411284 [Heterobasidion irregulare TC 32-1]
MSVALLNLNTKIFLMNSISTGAMQNESGPMSMSADDGMLPLSLRPHESVGLEVIRATLYVSESTHPLLICCTELWEDVALTSHL